MVIEDVPTPALVLKGSTREIPASTAEASGATGGIASRTATWLL